MLPRFPSLQEKAEYPMSVEILSLMSLGILSLNQSLFYWRGERLSRKKSQPSALNNLTSMHE